MPGSIDQLRPQARARCVAWLAACNDLILPVAFPGYHVHVTDTLRTADEQAKAQAAGLSDVSVGWHNFGLAWDFAVMDDKGVYVTDGSHPAYVACGTVGAALGCRYPIILKSGRPDADHIEYHPGVTLQQMIAADEAARNLTA